MKRPMAVAGSFYPAQAKALNKMLDRFAEILPVELPGETLGLLLPHAGYEYSGSVAALGYLSVGDVFDTVAVVGPSHTVAFQGASVFAGEAVQTPLGDLAVDQESAQIVMGCHESLRELPAAHEREHSVEVHFPLIKRFMPRAKILPVVTGHCAGRTAEILASALARLRKGRRFLLVASSDLSHFPDYDTAVEKDREFLEAVLTGDMEEVIRADARILGEDHPNLQCTHCGQGPLETILRYAKSQSARNVRLLQYRNSGDVTRDKDRVVGYAAVAFCVGSSDRRLT
jgi:MEMO1 family protein